MSWVRWKQEEELMVRFVQAKLAGCERGRKSFAYVPRRVDAGDGLGDGGVEERCECEGLSFSLCAGIARLG